MTPQLVHTPWLPSGCRACRQPAAGRCGHAWVCCGRRSCWQCMTSAAVQVATLDCPVHANFARAQTRRCPAARHWLPWGTSLSHTRVDDASVLLGWTPTLSQILATAACVVDTTCCFPWNLYQLGAGGLHMCAMSAAAAECSTQPGALVTNAMPEHAQRPLQMLSHLCSGAVGMQSLASSQPYAQMSSGALSCCEGATCHSLGALGWHRVLSRLSRLHSGPDSKCLNRMQ